MKEPFEGPRESEGVVLGPNEAVNTNGRGLQGSPLADRLGERAINDVACVKTLPD